MRAQRCDQRKYRSIGGDFAEVTLVQLRALRARGPAQDHYPSLPACDQRARGHWFLRGLLPTLLGAGPNLCSSAGGQADWLAGLPLFPLPCIE